MKPLKGIVVDGACSGNPGPGEYRGIDLESGKVLFHQKFILTTNNVMEFCGIVHALKYRKENNLDLYVYSDSVIGIDWAHKKKANSNLLGAPKTMYEFIQRCEGWLLNNTKNVLPVEKWLTKEWGEIPADFGNKEKKKQEKQPADDFIRRADLAKWIKIEEAQPMPDLTTLARLKRDFKIN